MADFEVQAAMEEETNELNETRTVNRTVIRKRKVKKIKKKKKTSRTIIAEGPIFEDELEEGKAI